MVAGLFICGSMNIKKNASEIAAKFVYLADKCHHHLELDIAYDIVGIKGPRVVAIDTSPRRASKHICQIVLASSKF